MIEAIVKDIQNCDSLHIVKFDFLGQTLTMMSLELSCDIQIGVKVLLQAKPSHVAIGKDTQGMQISYSNQLESQIVSITQGELLASLKLQVASDTILESIITKDSVSRLDIDIDDKVTAYIKASELSIVKVVEC
jgi:molybdopterin-binding protein